MKQLIFFPLLFLLVIDTYSQSNINTNQVYVFKENMQLEKCDGVGGNRKDPTFIYKYFEFKVDKILDSGLVIHFLQWKNDENKNEKYYQPGGKDSESDIINFFLPLNLFTKAIEKFRKAPFALGITVIPIKMRFGNKLPKEHTDKRYFTFESAVSLGFSIGLNVKLDKSKLSARNNIAFLCGVSLSSVPVDSFSTKGIATSATNNAAITGHLGTLYQIDNFQIGLFTGIDFLAGEIGVNWKYRRKPWFGIGLGYSIFQAKRTTDTQ